jgi:hypothetical protein
MSTLKIQFIQLSLLLSFSFLVFPIFSQLEFTKQERLLFVGSDEIEGKRIISGVYIMPIDSFHLELQLDILDDWVQKDSIHTIVEIDTSSINTDSFFILRNDKRYPAYRFYNTDGFELIIAKELKYSYISRNSSNETTAYMVNFVQLSLPKNNTYYVKTLPLMFNK